MLSAEEHQLRKELKFKCLGLASLARAVARQRSRITYVAEGDANTKFFHLQACHRTRQNFIRSLSHHNQVLVTEQEKSEAIFQHFNQTLGTYME